MSLRIRQRLAESDPESAAPQRDLWVSCWRVANVLEQLGSPDARTYWRRARDTLAQMVSAGWFVSATDRSFLDRLQIKIRG